MPRTVKGPEGGKRYPLSMRTTKEVRERLEAAATANGRSLAQEVEYLVEKALAPERGDVVSAVGQLGNSLANVQKQLQELLDSGTLKENERARDVVSNAAMWLDTCRALAAAAGSMVAPPSPAPSGARETYSMSTIMPLKSEPKL
jgi:hypothetical protein